MEWDLKRRHVPVAAHRFTYPQQPPNVFLSDEVLFNNGSATAACIDRNLLGSSGISYDTLFGVYHIHSLDVLSYRKYLHMFLQAQFHYS